MKAKALTTIVSALMGIASVADDTIYTLSDRMLMLEERTSASEKKIKQLSSAQTKTNKSLNETKEHVEELKHNQYRLELEQLRAASQPKVYTPQQPTFYSQQQNIPYTARQLNQDIPVARFSNLPEFVISPYNGRLVSIRGIPPRQLVKDPYCGRLFLIP